MDYRTPIARARGLGSAKEGTHHWWMQRITAIALVPLTVWLVGSLVAIGAADHAQTVHWIRSPAISIALLLTIAALFHHAQLGLQVVIEDYVHSEWKKLAALISVKLLTVAVAATAAFSVLRIALGS
ncbi:MAG: succinate dehydrogenase, hydrophobic membrane anchor protein [Thiotrichales bacterium]|nr:succinate dehydrogenase, hydrophobic membrane anchor protein [Thiotrichales bacterium]